MKRVYFIFIVIMVALICMISCSDTTKPGTVTSIDVTPATTTVSKGNSQQFTATVNGYDNPSQKVTWGLMGALSTATTINEISGLLFIATNETADVLTVTATSTSDQTKVGTATVTITQVTSVVVTPANVSVPKGLTQLFSAVVNGSNDPPQTVTWVVTGGVSGTSINTSGVLSVSNNETATTLTVRATSTFDVNKSGIATVNVTVPTVSSVVVSPTPVNVLKGQTQQFSAVVNGSNDPPQTVTWVVTGGVSGTSINTSGLLSVSNSETATTLTVRATSTFDTSKSGNATVSVPQITSVGITPDTATVRKGQTQQFSAVVSGSNNPPQTVTWSVTGGSSNNTFISPSGLLSVASVETATSLTVKATSTTDPSFSGSATVTVPQITSVVVSPATVTVPYGQTQQFSAVVNGLGSPPQTVSWSVTGGVYGTSINSSGLLTVASNETAISLIVEATSTIDTSISGSATVTATKIGTIGPGGGYVFYDKGSYSNGWRYLEAAPASSEFTAAWGLYGIACPGTSDGIGSGQANTTAIINLLVANSESGKAAQLCDALTINGYNDWFLPSKDELNQMYLKLRVGNNIGGFVISDNSFPYSIYWSSTAYNATSLYSTWWQRFSDGYRSSPTTAVGVVS